LGRSSASVNRGLMQFGFDVSGSPASLLAGVIKRFQFSKR
jgi:hypothetical protein